MLCVDLPGAAESLCLDHLVCDFNGTLSVDGQLFDGVAERLVALSHHLTVHLLSADTHGTLAQAMAHVAADCERAGVPAPQWTVVTNGAEKERVVGQLGPQRVVALGNGANDERMFRAARLSIAVILGEGAYAPTLQAATIVVLSPLDALDLLLSTSRLVATLRP